jgi:transketolase
VAAYIVHAGKEGNHRHPQGQPERHPGLAQALPEFLGGSADLTGSNLTNWKESVAVRADQRGNHINYGVREFGMSAIMNGIALHGGYIPSAPPS